MGRHCMIVLALTLIAVSVSLSMAVSDKDREECQEQLVGLATCLLYVEGNAKTPTPDCCNGLKQVLKANKKCLCVVIRDRNDPDLGLNINVTLALGLPDVCHAPANVSKCPELLHIPPNSPEAQVFYQLSNASNHDASAPASAPGSAGSQIGGNSQGPTSSNSEGSSAPKPSNYGNQRQFGFDMLSVGLIIWYLLM